MRDYQKARYATDKAFSKTGVCKMVGLPNTRSYFGDVVTGYRPLSNAKMEMFIKILELNPDEAQFFRFLVLYNQTVIKDEKEFFFNQLISINQTPKKFIDPAAYAYFKDWYHSAIRALLDVVEFSDDYKALGKMLNPRLTSAQTKASIQLLKKLRLIQLNKAGYWKPTDQIIRASSEHQKHLLEKFQASCIENSLKVLFSHAEKPRRVSTETMSISKKAYSRIEKKLLKFKSEVISIIHKDEEPADSVYQLIVQFFPQSH